MCSIREPYVNFFTHRLNDPLQNGVSDDLAFEILISPNTLYRLVIIEEIWFHADFVPLRLEFDKLADDLF